VLHELDLRRQRRAVDRLGPARSWTWDDVYDHIKIAHHPLLVTLDDGADHAGAYWDGTKMIVAEDLGPDLDEAVTDSVNSSANAANTSRASTSRAGTSQGA